MSGFTTAALFFAFSTTLLGCVIDFAARLRSRAETSHRATVSSRDDFAVLVPIYGDLRYLQNVAYLATYGSRVVLCTTTDESAEFYGDLEAVAATHGFRVFRGRPGAGRSSNSTRDTGGTTRDRLIRDVLNHLDEPHVVCIDADTVTSRHLGELVGAMHDAGFDIASVPLMPANQNSWLARLQAHEYRAAMALRRILPWLVCGGCHAGRTDALRQVMNHHSLFFQGNDVETGLLAERLGYRVGHVPFEVPTVVPSTVRGWLRQRIAWSGGEFRLFVVNLQIVRRHPFVWAYGLLLMYALFPLRWMSAASGWRAVAAVVVVYCAVLIALEWRRRDRWLLLMPLYGLFASLVLVGFALPSYAWMAIKARNAGRIRVRPSDDDPHRLTPPVRRPHSSGLADVV